MLFCTCSQTHTQIHTEKLIFQGIRSSVRQEAAWQTPACRIKTYHPLSFSPYRPGDFAWGLLNLVWGCYLFISSVIKGLGSITCLWWGGVQCATNPSVMDFSTQILHRFDLWYNIEWYAAHSTQYCHAPYWCNSSSLSPLSLSQPAVLEKGRTLKCTSRAIWLN